MYIEILLAHVQFILKARNMTAENKKMTCCYLVCVSLDFNTVFFLNVKIKPRNKKFSLGHADLPKCKAAKV